MKMFQHLSFYNQNPINNLFGSVKRKILPSLDSKRSPCRLHLSRSFLPDKKGESWANVGAVGRHAPFTQAASETNFLRSCEFQVRLQRGGGRERRRPGEPGTLERGSAEARLALRDRVPALPARLWPCQARSPPGSPGVSRESLPRGPRRAPLPWMPVWWDMAAAAGSRLRR